MHGEVGGGEGGDGVCGVGGGAGGGCGSIGGGDGRGSMGGGCAGADGDGVAGGEGLEGDIGGAEHGVADEAPLEERDLGAGLGADALFEHEVLVEAELEIRRLVGAILLVAGQAGGQRDLDEAVLGSTAAGDGRLRDAKNERTNITHFSLNIVVFGVCVRVEVMIFFPSQPLLLQRDLIFFVRIVVEKGDTSIHTRRCEEILLVNSS